MSTKLKKPAGEGMGRKASYLAEDYLCIETLGHENGYPPPPCP